MHGHAWCAKNEQHDCHKLYARLYEKQRKNQGRILEIVRTVIRYRRAHQLSYYFNNGQVAKKLMSSTANCMSTVLRCVTARTGREFRYEGGRGHIEVEM